MIELLKDHPLQSAGVVAVGTALYILYSTFNDKKHDGVEKIPTPKGKYPYLGHLPHIGKNAFLKIHEWHKELGPIIQVQMGVQDFVFISDSVIAHEIFNVNGSITTLRPSNKLGDGAYSLNGRGMGFPKNKKKLKESRLAASSILAPKVVDRLGDEIQFETDYLIDQLMSHGNTDEGVDPFHDITFRTLNLILNVCIGIRLDSTNDPMFMDILEINRLTMFHLSVEENIGAYIPALSFVSYLKGSDKKGLDFINNLRNPVLRKMINQALERDEECLLKKMKDTEEKIYDEDDMMMLVNDLIIAGTDTVSVTLSRAFFFLSHYPEIQKRICEEIDAFITKHKRLPKFTEREAFPYITSVQREILRLYPTTPLGLPHVAEQDFVVNNYMIKKGTTLLSNMYSMHRNPDIYSDPEKFIPERFINNKSTFYASANGKPTERDQYNFGWGRRICPGIYLAETELFMTYTTLWARCTIEPALDSNGNPVCTNIKSYVDGGVVSMPEPYKVRFVERPDRLL
ncbi:cytochrome P450 [Spinellus fusiger]|nr:cytochrome P450 [Spinellus fusiger]